MQEGFKRAVGGLWRVLVNCDNSGLFIHFSKSNFANMLKSKHPDAFSGQAPIIFQLAFYPDNLPSYNFCQLIFSRLSADTLLNILKVYDDDGENFLHYCAQNMALHIIEHIIDKFRKSRHPFDDIRLLASAKNSSQLNVLDIFKIQAKLKVLSDQDRERLDAIEQLLFGQKNDPEADQHQALLFRQRALDKAPIQLEKIAGKKIDKL